MAISKKNLLVLIVVFCSAVMLMGYVGAIPSARTTKKPRGYANFRLRGIAVVLHLKL